MNTDQQTYAMMATANKDRQKEMLQYVSEGATAADLEAAGYTPAEIAIIQPDKSEQPLVSTGTVENYTPTYRENLRENVRRGASALGAGKQTSQFISDRVAGSATNGELGITDLQSVLKDLQKELGADKFVIGSKDLDYEENIKIDRNTGALLPQLPITGTEVDFSGLMNSGVDLSKMRFARGGLVGYADGGDIGKAIKENPIWQHHMSNVESGKAVKNKDGSVSTVRTLIMGDGQYEYLIPTVWDGKILSDQDAWERAMSSGVNWPKAPAGEKGVASLEHLDQQLHKSMTPTGFAQGGTVETEQMDKLMQEGGIAGSNVAREPVTGNEVPPGSLPSEVRDNIDTNLSEGEYVVPADVVRFFGVKYFEDLRTQAKQGLQEMQSNGRIGGAAVDENGVPTEEDQLTPEEEQMLNQALGQSGAKPGMAYGGMVKGMAEGGATGTDTPAFDRTTFNLSDYGNSNNGIETRQYYNPKTKETRVFQFVGGQSLGLIPEGFVPWYEGIDKVEPTTDTNTGTSTGSTKSSNSKDKDTGGTSAGGTPAGGTTEGTDGANKWVSENFDNLNTDPYKAGMDALKDNSGRALSKVAGGVGLLAGSANPVIATGAAVVAGGVKAFSAVNNIAKAHTAILVMEAQGLENTPEYQRLVDATRIAVNDLTGAQQIAVDMGWAGTGNKYYEDYLAEQKRRAGAAANPNVQKPGGVQQGGGQNTSTYVPPQTRNDSGGSNATGAPITPKVTYSIGAGNTGTSGQVGSSSGAGPYSNGGGSGTSASTGTVKSSGVNDVTKSGTGIVSAPKSSGVKDVTSYGTSSSTTKAPANAGSTRFKDGGLVTKTKKTTPKAKGLAGKQ